MNRRLLMRLRFHHPHTEIQHQQFFKNQAMTRLFHRVQITRKMHVIERVGQIAQVIALAEFIGQRIMDRLREHRERFFSGADHHMIVQSRGEVIDGCDRIAVRHLTEFGRHHLVAVFIIGDLTHKQVGLSVAEHGRDILIVEKHEVQVACVIADTQLCHCTAAGDADRIHRGHDPAAYHTLVLGLYSGDLRGIRPIVIGARIIGDHVADGLDAELAEQSGALLPYAVEFCDRDFV